MSAADGAVVKAVALKGPLSVATNLSKSRIFEALEKPSGLSMSTKIDTKTSYGIFLDRRRKEGLDVGMKALQEWKKLPEDTKRQFQEEAQQARGHQGVSVSSAGDFHRRIQEEEKHVKRARPIDPNEVPKDAKRSKSKAEPIEVPRPNFPLQRAAPDRSDKRREMTQALRLQAEDRGGKVVTKSSHAVDLNGLSSRLSAPAMSFDWTHVEEELQDDSDQLTVDLPASSSSGCSTARGLLRQELQQRISTVQVKNLLAPPALADAGA